MRAPGLSAVLGSREVAAVAVVAATAGTSAVVGFVLAAIWAAVAFLAGSVRYGLNYLDDRHRGIGIRIGTVRHVPVYRYAYISSYAWGGERDGCGSTSAEASS